MRNTDISKPQLLTAINKAKRKLQRALGDPSVGLSLVQSDIFPVKRDVIEQWGKASHYAWDLDLKPFETPCEAFTVALYAGKTLCGLCENSVEKDGNGDISSIEINAVERGPTDDLKGLAIVSFVQANIQIARDLKAPNTSVFEPSPETAHVYRRLGFNRVAWDDANRHQLKVARNTSLNWKGIREHQRRKTYRDP